MKSVIESSSLRYLLVGGLVFLADTSSFMGLLSLGIYRPLASSSAFIIGICCHFLLNRQFSFKNFGRRMRHQIRTYLIVSGICLLSTVGIIELLSGMFRITPLAAKMVAVVVNLPLGYLGHKHLTFGKGIRGTLKHIASKSSSR